MESKSLKQLNLTEVERANLQQLFAWMDRLRELVTLTNQDIRRIKNLNDGLADQLESAASNIRAMAPPPKVSSKSGIHAKLDTIEWQLKKVYDHQMDSKIRYISFVIYRRAS